MLESGLVALVAFAYLVLLFAIAYYGDWRRGQGRSLIANPYIYTLSLAVYCTSWTFYGSVGKAATEGVTFLPAYLGPTIMAFFWWLILRKMLRICKANNLTTISDFLSLRFGKDPVLGAVATVGLLLAIVPYIGLQLKSVKDTFNILVHETPPLYTAFYHDTALYVGLVLAGFSILFGARHLDPTERHEGMVAAVAFESIVKLLIFLGLGIFVTYGLFSGWGEIFNRICASPQFCRLPQIGTAIDNSYGLFLVVTLLSMASILFLPRQFHMAVVENTDEKHILTAMWLLPLYLVLINLFVLPIAFGGLLFGLPAAQADTFVLRIPLQSGHHALALLAFLGGLSASTAMVAVASIAVSTMLLNSLVIPLAIRLRLEKHLPQYLLGLKRAGILLVILLGYLSYRLLGPHTMLVDMGLIAFCGVMQLVPTILGSLYWRDATRKGALVGLILGFSFWVYTLVLPTTVQAGWLSPDILTQGPWGIGFLKPTAFLGLAGLDGLTHAFFWSMLLNVAGFVTVSLFTTPGLAEAEQARRFIGEADVAAPPREKRFTRFPTLEEITRFMEKFIGPQKAREALQTFAFKTRLPEKDWGDRERLQLADAVELTLAGSIGPAAAQVIMEGYLSSVGSQMEDVFDLFGEVTSSLEESEQKLKRRVAELSVLYEAARRLTSSLYLPEVMEGVLDLLVERLGVEKCSVRLLEEDGRLHIKSYRGLSSRAKEWAVKPDMSSLLGQCLLTPQVISASDTSLFLDRLQGLMDEEPLASFVLAPIATQTLSLGVLTAASSQKGYFAKEHVEFFQSLAGQLALAVRSSQLVAHQIRNPVYAIGGFAHRLFKKLPPGSKNQQYAAIIIKEAERLEHLVKEMVETTMIFIPREEEHNLNQVVRGALGLMRTALEEKQVDLQLHLAKRLPPLIMDVGNIKRVILQLVNNALEAMASGGTLQVTTSSRKGMVELQIKDDGKGIPADILPRIFDTFFSTKPSGAGLGLPIVHKIIGQHGGEVLIDSEEKVGTTVTVRLPVAKMAQSPELSEPPRPS
jgi:sigma-B regulation protein RsbU (phosphoserine phosphatase)